VLTKRMCFPSDALKTSLQRSNDTMPCGPRTGHPRGFAAIAAHRHVRPDQTRSTRPGRQRTAPSPVGQVGPPGTPRAGEGGAAGPLRLPQTHPTSQPCPGPTADGGRRTARPARAACEPRALRPSPETGQAPTVTAGGKL